MALASSRSLLGQDAPVTFQRTLKFNADNPLAHELGAFFALMQLGQNQGAGVFTRLGLRLRHLAHKKRLPFTAVFGRTCFPLRGKFFPIETSTCNSGHKCATTLFVAAGNCSRYGFETPKLPLVG